MRDGDNHDMTYVISYPDEGSQAVFGVNSGTHSNY